MKKQDTWWTDLRWGIALRFIGWAIGVAPGGTAKTKLCVFLHDWSIECIRQRQMRGYDE